MKKTIVSVTLALGCFTSAHAATDFVSQLSAKVKSASVHTLDGTSTGAPPAPLSPSRQDKVHVRITKNTFTQLADGSYKFVSSDVCSSEGTFNVYENATPVGEINFGADDWARIGCASTFAGKTVEVTLGGALVTGKAKLFEEPQDIKALIAFVYIGTFGQNNMQQLNAAAAATGDVHANSLIANIQPSEVSASCTSDAVPNNPTAGARVSRQGSCSTDMNEYFIATVEIKD